MYLVKHFYEKHKKYLGLTLLAGQAGLGRRIKKAEVHRPGLSLAGYLKGFAPGRILVIGKQEFDYLRELDEETRFSRLKAILSFSIPAVIVAKGFYVSKELIALCDQERVPLFRVDSSATNLLSRITFLLLEEFCPSITLHATLVEVFGVGVLIEGESSIGKSEAALGLIERGHRLISDDVVQIRKKEGFYLVGSGPALTRHLMEIRGIGLINVAHLYGAICVRDNKRIDIVVKLEKWDDGHFYDRVGMDEKFIDILGSSIPFLVMPVKPGRDIVLLMETIALNQRLKGMGYNSAKEFNAKWIETVSNKQAKRMQVRESNT